MLGGDERRLKMAYSLAFSLPGTPVLFYGEEIGMAENPDIPGRLAVRSPMQWTGGTNGGFSTAAKRRLTRPLTDGMYGPERVNAADQRRDHSSFWWFMRDLIYTHRSQPEIGWSEIEILKQPNRAVLAHVCREESGWKMLALHNFGAEAARITVSLGDVESGSTLVDLLDGLTETEIGPSVELDLEPYGYRWLRVLGPQDDPII